jgi:protein-tyrosine-phosphatase
MAKEEQQGLRLLFVCSGNTCRSPMAAGIAQEMLQGRAYVKSAGIYAYGDKAAQEAIEVMQRHLGIDISEHRPRAVENLLLNDFDYIIVMGSYEYEHLKSDHQIIPSKLIKWDIEDPYGQGIEAYEKCASKIQSYMQDLLTFLTANLRSRHNSSTCDDGRAQGFNLSDAVDQLRTDIGRWRGEIEIGKLRGTLLIGIGSKAARTFDKLLRDLLKFYLFTCNVNYDQTLRKDMDGKSLEKLTMGQVRQCFEKMDRLFTKCCRLLSPKIAQFLKKRSLLTKPVTEQLDRAIEVRNKLYHPDEYVKDMPVLENDIKRMLILIQDILADALFGITLLFKSAGQRRTSANSEQTK